MSTREPLVYDHQVTVYDLLKQRKVDLLLSRAVPEEGDGRIFTVFVSCDRVEKNRPLGLDQVPPV